MTKNHLNPLWLSCSLFTSVFSLSPCTLHPAPCTLHPAPCTQHPAPSTLHPAPCTLHPAPCTLHPAPCTLHPAPLFKLPYLYVPERHLIPMILQKDMAISGCCKGWNILEFTCGISSFPCCITLFI